MHSSKTMRMPSFGTTPTGMPILVDRAAELIERLRALTPAQLSTAMAISPDLAAKTKAQYDAWTPDPAAPAAETFVGDIYSGLRVDSFGPGDRRYADAHLRILSGLYGIMRPFDGIQPYRLEMGYRLPGLNLYQFWGTQIAEQLPATGQIVNLAAAEYSRTVTRYVDAARIVTPKFLTVDPKSRQPKFIVVHAKIARGAFARWMVTERSTDLTRFDDIGYGYDARLSSDREPVFVCAEFGGKGLSVRLT